MKTRFPVASKMIGLLLDVSFLTLGAYFANAVMGKETTETLCHHIVTITVLCWLALLNVNGQQQASPLKIEHLIQNMVVTFMEVTALVSYILIATFEFEWELVTLTLFLQFALLLVGKIMFWALENNRAPKKVLILGDRPDCARIINKLLANPGQYQEVYVCHDLSDGDWQTAVQQVDFVIVAPSVSPDEKQIIIHSCIEHGRQPLLIPEVYELFFCNKPIRSMDDIPVFQIGLPRLNLEQRIIKRVFDVVVGSVALAISLPLLVIIASMIKISDKGPVLYTQVRVGRDGKEFVIYKFRTMVVNAEKITGPSLAKANDPRITRVGRILRSTRMDELPQLLNVLIGNMSLVGPRPERPVFVHQFEQDIPGYGYRHYVKPGITGLAQINSGYATSAADKLVYDLMYIQKYSVLLDILILFRTAKVLLDRESASGAAKSDLKVNLRNYRINHIG